MGISNCISVLEEQFKVLFLEFSKHYVDLICKIFSNETDPKAAREKLGNMFPNQYINVRVRLSEKQPPFHISSFTHNFIIMPMHGGKIKLNKFKLDKNSEILQQHDELILYENDMLIIDESTEYYSVEILEAGIFLEARDKKNAPLTHYFDTKSLEKISSQPTDKKNVYVFNACKVLAKTKSHENMELLFTLANTSDDDLVRWQAAIAYHHCANGNESFNLFKKMAADDPNITIRQKAQSTLEQLNKAI